MTQKPTPIVYADVLPQSGLEYNLIDLARKKILVNVGNGVPHAVLRDRSTGSDIGIVCYEKENGLPYIKFDRGARYLFWGHSDILRANRIGEV